MTTTTWADVEINEANFPEWSFRSWILEQEYGKDGILTDDEIAEVTDINVNGRTIFTLKGIEYFTSLTSLNCSYNYNGPTGAGLSDLDLSKNTELERLYCDNCIMRTLNISGCTKLKYLQCYNNQLTSLDLSKNTALTELYCFTNQLTSLDVSKNATLTRLDCYSNKITSLDVSNNTMLTNLNCNGNQLTLLDVTHNLSLKELNCSDNPLTVLSLSKNTILTNLQCQNSQLSTLNISGCKTIEKLWCSSCKITAIDVSGCSALTEILCQNNQISSLNVSGCISLTGLECFDNELTALDLSGCSALVSLLCQNNKLTVLNINKSIKSLTCSNNLLTELDLSFYESITDVYCSNNQLNNLFIGGCTSLQSLSCQHNRLTSLNVSNCSSMRELYCNENQLTSLVLTKKDESIPLYTLNCAGNQLTSLNVTNCYSLEYLSCHVNKLTSLDVTKNYSLRFLNCNNNQLSALNVSENNNLRELICYYNQFKGESMDMLINNLPARNLGYIGGALRCIYHDNESNIMTSAQVEAARAKGWAPYYFTGVYEYDNELWREYVGSDPLATDVEINEDNFPDENFRNWILSQPNNSDDILTPTELSYFTQIEINGKGIKSLKGIEYFSRLKYLTCSDNELTSLDVSKNKMLTDLNCNHNKIADIAISNNEALKRFECQQNQLVTLNVSGCTGLESLQCQYNQLKDLNVSGCTRLISINCSNNIIRGKAMDAFIKSMPERNEGEFRVIYSINSLDDGEKNVMTTIQVEAAKAKGWQAEYYYSGYYNNYWGSYEGSDPLMGEGVNINESTFPDENFRNYILTQRGASDGVLTPIEILNIKYVSVGNQSITSLKGIEYLKALTNLSCEHNQLTSLDLSENTALVYLQCYSNKIKGKAMDDLIEGLPIISNVVNWYDGQMQVLNYENESNIMTTTQVEAAKAKGWKPYYNAPYDYYYRWQEYAGSEPVLRGDANGDGEIGMPDVMFIVNYILGTPDASFNAEAADANQDGEVGMPDVMYIVNYILNGKFPEE